MIIQGKLNDDYLPSAEFIENYYKTKHDNSNNISYHYWINDIEDEELRKHIENLRCAPEIKDKIREHYIDCDILSVHTSDEVYLSVSPDKRHGSDITLSDGHYDAPFSWVPQGGNIFLRVILGCNENSTVYTRIEDYTSTLSTLDFNVMDYNRDFHYVEGYIPENKQRILLKLHFIAKPPMSSKLSTFFCEYINDKWTHFSREVMRVSIDPETPFQHALKFTTLSVRWIFNKLRW